MEGPHQAASAGSARFTKASTKSIWSSSTANGAFLGRELKRGLGKIYT
jgi:hypothetical protein